MNYYEVRLPDRVKMNRPFWRRPVRDRYTT